jgi:DNA-binding response OmpR family regulator
MKTIVNKAKKINFNEEHQNIMVVENDLNDLKFLNHTLEAAGYDTIVVVDEEAAMGVLDKVAPDMVVVDTVRPDAVTLHTIDRMREHSNVPIMVLTSDNEIGTLQQSFAHGADDFVHKPFVSRVLAARIRAKLRRSHVSFV